MEAAATVCAGPALATGARGPVLAVTVIVDEFERPPPGVGLLTVIATEPAVAISAAGISADNCVGLIKVVVLSVLPMRTVELATKFWPFTVRVMPGVPATTFEGFREVIAGRGAFTLNGCAEDVPPFGGGVVTVIFTAPEAATRLAGICALNCVALRKLVVSAVPFQLITDPEV